MYERKQYFFHFHNLSYAILEKLSSASANDSIVSSALPFSMPSRTQWRRCPSRIMKKCIEDVTSLQLRLKKIIGQLTGVQKMLAEDIPCEDILTQLNAANGALHRLSFIVLDGHLRHCVREGIEKGNADETIESFAEALESFSKMA